MEFQLTTDFPLPLKEKHYTAEELVPKDGKRKILIFYSSLEDDGYEWCPFCSRISDFLKTEVQKGEEAEEGEDWKIIRVGHKSEWKNPTNYFRQGPFFVKGVPTVIKIPAVPEGKEVNAFEHIKNAERCTGSDLFNPAKRTAFLEINPWMYL
ncbi:hypothetical protein BT69DRAFT_1279650 [Atractiella rhizophila]|nr:hypothetical protein BT69DRAFT_1279650 [Atractiella rhizophila]